MLELERWEWRLLLDVMDRALHEEYDGEGCLRPVLRTPEQRASVRELLFKLQRTATQA